MWDCRAPEKHWVETNLSPRSNLKPGDLSILHEPLVDRMEIFPPLHIKQGLTKQFAKALPTDGDCFSTSSCNFLGNQLKKSRPVYLMVHKLGSSPKMNGSLELC